MGTYFLPFHVLNVKTKKLEDFYSGLNRDGTKVDF
jgi:hypothetical protein